METTDLFGKFLETIGAVPVNAIYRVTEREKEMIEEDISCSRPIPAKDSISILNFCRFLHASMLGMPFDPAALPPNHIGFYRQILTRMVAAKELPVFALQQFDLVFLSNGSEKKSLPA